MEPARSGAWLPQLDRIGPSLGIGVAGGSPATVGPAPASMPRPGHGPQQLGAVPEQSRWGATVAGYDRGPGANTGETPTTLQRQPVFQRPVGDSSRLSGYAPNSLASEPKSKGAAGTS